MSLAFAIELWSQTAGKTFWSKWQRQKIELLQNMQTKVVSITQKFSKIPKT